MKIPLAISIACVSDVTFYLFSDFLNDISGPLLLQMMKSDF